MTITVLTEAVKHRHQRKNVIGTGPHAELAMGIGRLTGKLIAP